MAGVGVNKTWTWWRKENSAFEGEPKYRGLIILTLDEEVIFAVEAMYFNFEGMLLNKDCIQSQDYCLGAPSTASAILFTLPANEAKTLTGESVPQQVASP